MQNRVASNPIVNCRFNEKYILHLLRLKQRESKANLARETGLTAAAVGGIISSLQEKGLVEKVGKVQGDMGQPATLFSLAREGAYGLGVSINRGHIETVLINFVGEVVVTKKHTMILPTPDIALDLIHKDLSSLLESLPSSVMERIAGIGIAQPYNIGSWKQESHTDWHQWDDFDLALELEKLTGLPTVTQNDANAAAIAELIYGVGVKSEDFIYLFFGSPLVQSLGGGLVLDGDCRNGASWNAGDIGLLPVEPGAITTSHSKLGHSTTFLTNRCSLHSLVVYLRSEGATIESQAELSTAMEAMPQAVTAWVEDCVSALEIAVYAFQSIVDVPEFILDCEDDDLALVTRIIERLKQKLEDTPLRGLTMPKIRKGSFGSDASAIGAATLPLDSTYSPKAKFSDAR